MFLPPNMRIIAEDIEESISHIKPLGMSDDIHNVLCEIRNMQDDMQKSEEKMHNEISDYKQSDAKKSKQEAARYWLITAISVATLIVAIIALFKQ
ncbi:MAG: hypothetical protein IIW54_13095 [Lachnospiraceae bacterium]|nr:hypothetical protein [Lachnospiraceae bacterium]